MTHPMFYGVDSEKIENPVTTRRIYLPAGNDWFDFYTLERYTGYGYEQSEFKLTRVFWDDENRKLSVNR